LGSGEGFVGVARWTVVSSFFLLLWQVADLAQDIELVILDHFEAFTHLFAFDAAVIDDVVHH
jgi:hypothetical protein